MITSNRTYTNMLSQQTIDFLIPLPVHREQVLEWFETPPLEIVDVCDLEPAFEVTDDKIAHCIEEATSCLTEGVVELHSLAIQTTGCTLVLQHLLDHNPEHWAIDFLIALLFQLVSNLITGAPRIFYHTLPEDPNTLHLFIRIEHYSETHDWELHELN